MSEGWREARECAGVETYSLECAVDWCEDGSIDLTDVAAVYTHLDIQYAFVLLLKQQAVNQASIG